MVSRQEYESEINRLQSLITKANQQADYWQRDKESNFRSKCAGMDFGECDKWKVRQAEVRDGYIQAEKRKAENYKQELWDFQKRIAQDEQDAQVKAVREAIADQVRLEQERIQAEQQNAIIETPTIKNPVAQIQKEVIQPQTNKMILPLAVVAGVLLL